MRPIEEESKHEMSISPPPLLENTRICLVGDVANDAATVEAAYTFGIPVIISDTGLELMDDLQWRTHYILKVFEGPVYDAIHKSKQCILGPPALQQAAELRNGLIQNARPIYSYSMRGVVTCFTGIRKKDELTKLVNLIHSMGGCIRKDMNSKITHLISNHSGGEKYQYAKTFRLTVVRPDWVYAAWERRDELQFRATTEDFSKDHKLKAFERQKICFFGFPADEHQHMVDVLKSNGGVPAELDDPQCSHVVMPNSGGYFPEICTNTASSPKHDLSINPNSDPYTNPYTNPNSNPESMEVDVKADDAVASTSDDKENNEIIHNGANNVGDDAECCDLFVEGLSVDYALNKIEEQADISPLSAEVDEEEDDNVVDLQAVASTPKLTPGNTENAATMKIEIDGIVLSNADGNAFQNPNNISPILCASHIRKINDTQAALQQLPSVDETAMETEDIDDDQFLTEEQKDLKRKRESSDSASLMSISSFVQPASTKKPKLIRTGSITRSIRRSMSFVAVRTPIAKMLRPRRSSVAFDGADVTANANEADESFCSIASVESTFNESIRRPVKEKLRSIRQRITRSSSKKEKCNATAPKTPEKMDATDCCQQNDRSAAATTTLCEGFKTPKAPTKHNTTITSLTAPATTTTAAAAAAAATTAKPTTPISSKQYSSNITAHKIHSGVGALHNTSTIATTTITITATNNSANISSANCNTAITSATYSTQLMCSQEFAHQVATRATTSLSMQIEGTLAPEQAPPRLSNHSQNDAGNLNTNTVVDEHTTQAKPEPRNNRTHILKSDWFWYTIQNGYADEMDYLFGDYLDSIANTPDPDRRDSMTISFNKRKRIRLSHQRLQLEGTPLSSNKRRSSISDAGLLSVSGSFFDCTSSPDKLECGKLHAETETPIGIEAAGKKSMRFNHFMDFFNTESNYVGILDTIVNLFKNPLEEMAESNDALLNKSEIKSIFGNFLPIHEVHQGMLECLRAIHTSWAEDCSIGEIIMQYRDDLIKAYPPYVNYFEQMKESLLHCDNQNPRFHAFLKINQTKPECGRQSLQDLMIRPVQRLPSVSLLLNDILKHTNKTNPDYARLEEALKAIKEVMMHINEDKRRTESRMAIFDIFNDIEGCPAHLVSSNRNFISKCEVIELSDHLSGRGDALLLYLFSDTIEVCKKRSRGFNSAKSPSTSKSYKHIKLISLNAIRFVIDITDSPRAFALLCRQDKDKLFSFTIADEEIDKVMYLKTLCKQMAENACRTDTDKALLCGTSQELEVDISDVNVSTLSKAFKLAARTRLKVGRALTFNRTPSKLKRAVSTMMTSPFGSTNSLTPATQLAQMRLGLSSCTNISEIADEGGRSSSPSALSEILPPLTMQPARKSKTSTIPYMGRI